MAKRASGSKKSAARSAKGSRGGSLASSGTDKRFVRRAASGQFRETTKISRARPSADRAASHVHIECTAGVRGGRPRIRGRRITVDDIAIMHLRLGQPIEEIVGKYDLSFAEVHAALTFYFDHKEEVDRQIATDDAMIEALRRDNPSPLRERLKALRDA